jgi:hypothetical protein
MNVSGENGGELRRNVAPPNDVGSSREREIAWTDCRPFDTVVNAEQPVIGVMIAPIRSIDQRPELPADLIALIRKSGQRDTHASDVGGEGAGRVEDVNVSVRHQPGMREPRAFVIPGNDEHRNSEIGNSPERTVRLVRDARVGCRSVEDIPAVNDEIGVTGEGRCESGRIVGEEIESTASAPNAGADR